MASDDDIAAGILCSLRSADLAGWTPPRWKLPPPLAGEGEGSEAAPAGQLAWPAVARGKRSRRRSPPEAASSGKRGRWARGSPASPLEYSGGSGSGSGSGSGASTSGGDDGTFCSPPPPPPVTAAVGGSSGVRHAGPAAPSKVGSGGRRPLILPVQTPPRPGGPRSRKKMRLPEIKQLVRSLADENESLRQEREVLQRACATLSDENCKLETRLEHSSPRNEFASQDHKGKQQVEQSPQDSFMLPDLNLPAQEVTGGLMP